MNVQKEPKKENTEIYKTIPEPKGTSLSDSQSKIQSIAYHEGKNICSHDECFSKILQAIAWQESSFGSNNIGDGSGNVYFYEKPVLKNGRTYFSKRTVHKDLTFLENSVRYILVRTKSGETKYRVKINFAELGKSSLGAFQIKVKTAKDVITKMELKEYYALLNNDNLLIVSLLNDTKFGAIIAGNYLKMNYQSAKKNGHKNPIKYAISRYNGGANNTIYISLITDKMKKLDS
jgi:hypothetical protein